MSEANIERALGELSGLTKGVQKTLDQLHQDVQRLREEARTDNARIERALTERIEAHGKVTNQRFEEFDRRIVKLEDKAEQTTVQIAKISATTGTIGGLLTAGAIEVIKHTFFK